MRYIETQYRFDGQKTEGPSILPGQSEIVTLNTDGKLRMFSVECSPDGNSGTVYESFDPADDSTLSFVRVGVIPYESSISFRSREKDGKIRALIFKHRK